MSNTKPKTIIGRLQEYLEEGNKIDVYKFAEMFESMSLPIQIRYLKKRGFNIKSAKKEGSKVTEYWIEK